MPQSSEEMKGEIPPDFSERSFLVLLIPCLSSGMSWRAICFAQLGKSANDDSRTHASEKLR
jgi:hypothetical protein